MTGDDPRPEVLTVNEHWEITLTPTMMDRLGLPQGGVVTWEAAPEGGVLLRKAADGPLPPPPPPPSPPLPDEMDWREVRARLIEIVDRVHATGRPLTITRDGKAVALITPHAPHVPHTPPTPPPTPPEMT